MAKGKASSGANQVVAIAVYVLLIGALGTYFLPIMSINLPAFGKKSWSVKDIVNVIPKSLPKGGGQKVESKGKLSINYDFNDLIKEISPKAQPGKGRAGVSRKVMLGALVPVALAFAYLLAIVSLLLALSKNCSAFVASSIAAAACSVYALAGTYLLAQATQKAFSDSMAKVESSPFGAIAKNFVQQVTIQPETGLYALAVLTVLAFIFGLYQKNKPA